MSKSFLSPLLVSAIFSPYNPQLKQENKNQEVIHLLIAPAIFTCKNHGISSSEILHLLTTIIRTKFDLYNKTELAARFANIHPWEGWEKTLGLYCGTASHTNSRNIQRCQSGVSLRFRLCLEARLEERRGEE